MLFWGVAALVAVVFWLTMRWFYRLAHREPPQATRSSPERDVVPPVRLAVCLGDDGGLALRLEAVHWPLRCIMAVERPRIELGRAECKVQPAPMGAPHLEGPLAATLGAFLSRFTISYPTDYRRPVKAVCDKKRLLFSIIG